MARDPRRPGVLGIAGLVEQRRASGALAFCVHAQDDRVLGLQAAELAKARCVAVRIEQRLAQLPVDDPVFDDRLEREEAGLRAETGRR